MCGRNSLFAPARVLEQRFEADLLIPGYRPQYNITPGQPHPVVTSEAPTDIVACRWGLRPKWAGPDHDGFINARAETAHEKPAFKEAWESRPCLVLTSGFYEWRAADRGPKQPFRIYRPGDPAFAMAGLWEPSGDRPGSVTILTTEPNDLVAPIHDRMPVVLRRSDEGEWVTGDAQARRELCRPYPGDDLDAYPISRRVNNPSNDDPTIIERIDDPQTGLGEFA